MPCILDSKWDGATNYHCGLEVAVEEAEETESLQGKGRGEGGVSG